MRRKVTISEQQLEAIRENSARAWNRMIKREADAVAAEQARADRVRQTFRLVPGGRD